MKINYRTSLGITDRLSVGILLTYWDKDISKQVWKKKPDNTWIKKSVSFHAFGFGDIWLTGLYKIVQDHPTFEAISVGVGYKLDASYNPLVVRGISTGSKDIRFALLTHENLTSRIHICTSTWYEYRGKVRHIEVKNEQGDLVEWEKSGRDIGDAFGYNLAVEIPLEKEGHYELLPLFSGWNKLADKNKSGDEVKYTKFYQHSVGLGFRYLPKGEKFEHCKFMVSCKTPIKSVNSFVAPVSIQFNAMWTF